MFHANAHLGLVPSRHGARHPTLRRPVMGAEGAAAWTTLQDYAGMAACAAMPAWRMGRAAA
jgi:hypothetical protein